MIDLQSIVWIVLYLLIAGAVLGLLLFLVGYIATQFPSEAMNLFARVARVLIVVLAVLMLIGILIGMISGTPLFYWGQRPPNQLH